MVLLICELSTSIHGVLIIPTRNNTLFFDMTHLPIYIYGVFDINYQPVEGLYYYLSTVYMGIILMYIWGCNTTHLPIYGDCNMDYQAVYMGFCYGPYIRYPYRTESQLNHRKCRCNSLVYNP